MKQLLICALALGACASEGDPPTGPELTGETFTVNWGPVTVEPGGENTQCVTVDLGNEAPAKIHEIRNQLGTTSHHLIVYRIDDASPDATSPVDCTPFAGTLSPSMGAAPLMITQKHDDTLTLPTGVAYSFAAHQRVRLELHFFNSTDQPQVAMATSTFAVGTPEQIRDEASFLFIGTPDIELAPRSQATVEAYFTPPESLAGVKYYAITGHTHALGTDVQVAIAPARDSTDLTPIYAPAPFSWSEPPTERHDPAFELPDGGGFRFHCDYVNTTDVTVGFGESATDEMCFFWAYYYPSQGARMCVHSTIAGGPDGLDVCCPADRGDQLSEYVCAQLAED
jgi:hypothetical protein